MNTYLYIWNPTRWTWHDQQEAIFRISNEELYDIHWSCGNTKRIEIGDIFFLLKLGVEPKGIIGCGYIVSKPYLLPHWNKKKAALGKSALRTDMLFKTLSEEPIIPTDYLQRTFPNFNWTPQRGGVSIPADISSALLSIFQSNTRFTFPSTPVEELTQYAEGKPKEVTYKTYDRSALARQECIKHHGYKCNVCSFDFEKVYGSIGSNYIEVHHLQQLSVIGEEHLVDPIRDLRPVCSNCHRMLHKRNPTFSIEELTAHINKFKET